MKTIFKNKNKNKKKHNTRKVLRKKGQHYKNIKKTRKTKKIKQGGGETTNTNTLEPDLFQSSVITMFKYVSEENSWTDHAEAAQSFLEFLKNMPESGTELETYLNEKMNMNYGGGMLEDIKMGAASFPKYIATLAGFNLNTSCDKLFSAILAVVYSIMLSAILKRWLYPENNIQEMSNEEFLSKTCEPAQYVLFFRFRLLYNIQENFFLELRQFMSEIMPNINIQIVERVMGERTPDAIVTIVRSAIYSPALKSVFEKTVSCMLMPFTNICEDKCKGKGNNK